MQPVITYRVPDLTEGLAPVRRHPLADEVCEYTIDWMARAAGEFLPAELAEEFARGGSDTLVSYLWPDTVPDRLRLLTVINGFAFMPDDVASGKYADILSPQETRAWLGQYAAACAGRTDRLTARWALDLADLWQQTMELKPRKTVSWMRQEWLRWMASYNDDPPKTFSEEERFENGGGPVSLAITASSLGLDVSQAMNDALFRAAAHDAMVLSLLINDVISFGKEILTNDDARNPIRMFMESDHLPVQEAVDRVCARISTLRERYLQRRAHILDSPLGRLSGAADFLTALESVITGVARFHATAPRYRSSPESTWDGSGPALVHVFPDRVVNTAVLDRQ